MKSNEKASKLKTGKLAKYIINKAKWNRRKS